MNEKQAQFFLPRMQFFTVDETNNSKKYFSTIHFYYYLVEREMGEMLMHMCPAIHIHNDE
jgi:hypothetical protein